MLRFFLYIWKRIKIKTIIKTKKIQNMENHFARVKEYLTQLKVSIKKEDSKAGVFVIDDEEEGIKNMVIVCDEPILIMQQFIFDVKHESIELYKSLLQKNQDIVHGAFALDETGKKVIFRDTLQLENLDLNELEGSLKSLTLLLSEYYKDIMKFSA